MRPVLLNLAAVAVAASAVRVPAPAAVDRALFPDGPAVGDGWRLAYDGPAELLTETVCSTSSAGTAGLPVWRADYDGARCSAPT